MPRHSDGDERPDRNEDSGPEGGVFDTSPDKAREPFQPQGPGDLAQELIRASTLALCDAARNDTAGKAGHKEREYRNRGLTKDEAGEDVPQ